VSAAAPALVVLAAFAMLSAAGAARAQASQAPATPAMPVVVRDCPQCPEMIVVPAGAFAMGTSTDAYEHDVASGETPPFNVRIRRPFALGRFEVTHAEFATFRRATGYEPALACASDAAAPAATPVRCIGPRDAREYLAWLSGVTGRRYRLPSESEWEYATRAGTPGARFWSARHSHEGVSISMACDYGNVYDVAARALALGVPHARCTDGYADGPAPVGSFLPNPLGFHDLIGNVRERLADCFTNAYKGRPPDERAWVWDECRYHAVRGGSWRSRPLVARSAARDYVADDAAADALQDVGFRVARDVDAP
jgi:formylglycine-generating enzyme required for sulfatase activity